jgi:hypothetical protein
MSHLSVLVVDKNLKTPGVLANTAFVLGLTAGRALPDATFGPAVVDGDGVEHTYLTNIAHFVREAGQSKLRSLRAAFAQMADVHLVDYTEDAAPSDYATYQRDLAAHSGDQIVYRALHVYGPEEQILPLTKNLSRL